MGTRAALCATFHFVQSHIEVLTAMFTLNEFLAEQKLFPLGRTFCRLSRNALKKKHSGVCESKIPVIGLNSTLIVSQGIIYVDIQ